MALDVMSMFARLGLDKSEYEKGMKEAEGGFKNFGSNLKKGVANVAKIAAGAAAAGATALAGITVALTKSAVSAYGEFEQLSGGIETLFKDSADAISMVKKNAQDAYATAGLSANEYMKTVSSFSAALIQSTGRGAQQDIDAMKKNLDDQYDATKRHWEERIRLTKDSGKKASLRYQMQDELKALKEHNKQALAEAERANQSSKNTTESVKRAAELADLAVRDMSDNANKMGTDMASIQNAYAGFSKQNYTMLDNLKLGYGGTKEEMERLLRKAEDIKKAHGEVAHYSISSYADIVEAIHEVQNEMGITGATAAEAEKTIEGSINATKAAWENVLTSIGTGKGMKEATKNLVASAGNVIKNVKPVIQRALSGIGDLIAGLAPVIVKEAPGLIFSIVPSFIRSVGRAVTGVMKALPQAISDGWNTIKNNLMTNGVQKIALFLNQIITGGADKSFGPAQQRIQFRLTKLFDNIFKLGSAIADKAGQLWTGTLQPMLQDAVAFLVDKVLPAVNNVITFITDNLDTIVPLIGGVVAGIAAFAIGKKISNIVGVVSGLFKVIQAHPFALIISAIGAVVGYLVHLYQTNEEARDKINAAFEAIKGFWESTLKPAFEDIYKYVVETLIPGLIEWWDTKLKPTIQGVFEAIAGFWNDTLRPTFEAIWRYVTVVLVPQLIEWWDTKLKPTIQTVFEAIKGFWEGTLRPAFEDIYAYVVTDLIPTLIVWWEYHLQPAIETVFNAIKGFWTGTLRPAFEDIYEYVTDTLIPTLQEKWEAIQPVIETVFNAIKGFWTGTLRPAFEDIYEYVTETLIPTLQEKWEAIQPVLQTVFDAISGFVGDMGDKFQYVWDTYLQPLATWIGETFVTAWDTLQTQMQNLLDFISGVFSGDWSKAWDALVAMVATPFEGLKDILKTPINAVIDLLNGMITKVRDAINTVVEAINSRLHITIPSVNIDFDITRGLNALQASWDFGNPLWDWSPKISKLNWGDNPIPQLAGGGIVGNGGEAIVGEYRPEHLRVVNGRAVVTPLNTGRFPGGGQEIVVPRSESRQLTVILELDRQQMGKAVYRLNNEETQRVGVRLANGGAY